MTLIRTIALLAFTIILTSCFSTSTNNSYLNPEVRRVIEKTEFENISGIQDSIKRISSFICTNQEMSWIAGRDLMYRNSLSDSIYGIALYGKSDDDGDYCNSIRYKVAKNDSINKYEKAFVVNRKPLSNDILGIEAVDRIGFISDNSEFNKGWDPKAPDVIVYVPGVRAFASIDDLIIGTGLSYYEISGGNSITFISGQSINAEVGYSIYKNKNLVNMGSLDLILGVSYDMLKLNNVEAFEEMNGQRSNRLGPYLKVADRIYGGPLTMSFDISIEKHNMITESISMGTLNYSIAVSIGYLILK